MIAGEKVGWYSEVLEQWFGKPHWEWDDKIADIIEVYLDESEGKTYTFPTVNAFIQSIIPKGVHLLIQQTHPSHGGPYTIKMTGSRAKDFEASNAQAKLSHTPYGYTWHHKERIVKKSTGIYCKMYLLETVYHRRWPHKGAVYEYVMYTGSAYK